MKFTRAVLILAALLAQASGCFLDLFHLCHVSDTFSKAINELPEKAAKAAEETLDHMFNDLLPPAIDKITASAKQLEDQGEKDYELALNATRVQLEAVMTKVVDLAKDLAKDLTKDVEEMVATIEKETLGMVKQIITDIDDKVNKLLSRLENDGKELFCAATGYISVLQQEFASYFQATDCECIQAMLKETPGLVQDCPCSSCFHIGRVYPRCPCNPWSLSFSKWYNRAKYQALKCHLNKVIDWQTWKVDQIVNQLSIIQQAALSFRCLEDMNPGSTINRNFFTNEYTTVSHDILVLRQPVAKHAVMHLPALKSVNMPRAQVQLQDDSFCQGKTMQECLIALMAAMKTSQGALQTAKSDLDDYVRIQDQTEAAEMKLFYKDCPDGWEEATMTKGYVLVGRPDGATAGTQLNTPLSKGELGRVGPHGHSVTDSGHSHTVTDPGHWHDSGMDGGRGSSSEGEHDTSGRNQYNIRTSTERTGIRVNSATSGIHVPSGNVNGLANTDHYPLLYVVVCQKKATNVFTV